MDHSVDQPTSTVTMPFRWVRNLTLSTDVLVAGTLLLLVIILWLPFGFGSGLTGDGWHAYAEIDRGVRIDYMTRPLIATPWRLAYALTPGHFVGANLLQLALMFAKGLLSYTLLKKLYARLDFAFAIAILAALFPADRGVFYLGALVLHYTVFCHLAALYMLFRYWEKQRWIYAVGMGVAQALSLGAYEGGFPLMLATPLILILLPKRPTRHLFRTALLWSIVPVTAAVWLGLIILTQPNMIRYQSALVAETSISSILSSLIIAYRRHFVDGWIPESPVWMLYPSVSPL